MSTQAKIKARIQHMKRGAPFSISAFYALGSVTSVQKGFSRLTQEGFIERASKGFYVRPKSLASIPSIKVTTSAEQVARAWARQHNYILVLQGLEAAYRVGFQTQAPIKKIFWTNGPTRRFKMGNDVVEARHITPNKLRWGEKPEGLLLRSMSVTSPESVGWSGLKKAFSRLSLSPSEASQVVKKLRNSKLPQQWEQTLTHYEEVLTS